VLTEDRLTVICWGDAPDPKSFETPVVDFDVGEEHACAVIEGGDVRCWGSDRFDRTGLDDPIRGISDVKQISAGVEHTCALKNDATVWCWGNNGERQLGRPLGDPDGSGLPVQAEGVSDAVEVYSEVIHTCARFDDGSIECWGGFEGREIYNYRASEYREPTLIFPFTSDVIDFDTGRAHNCALKSDGKAYCWGNNRESQLGNESADYQEEDAVEVMF
jgi:alpha-tubulin suppressor-like RCC1 family protein